MNDDPRDAIVDAADAYVKALDGPYSERRQQSKLNELVRAVDAYRHAPTASSNCCDVIAAWRAFDATDTPETLAVLCTVLAAYDEHISNVEIRA